MLLLSLLGCLLFGFLLFGRVEQHIASVDWASLLRPYAGSYQFDSSQRPHFQFRQTKIFLAPTVHESTAVAADSWASYYGYISSVPHLTVSPRTTDFGEESYWISGIESTFTKSLLFRRHGVEVWLYYDGPQEDVRALASLIDQRLKSDRNVAPITGTPIYVFLQRRWHDAQRTFYRSIYGPSPIE